MPPGPSSSPSPSEAESAHHARAATGCAEGSLRRCALRPRRGSSQPPRIREDRVRTRPRRRLPARSRRRTQSPCCLPNLPACRQIDPSVPIGTSSLGLPATVTVPRPVRMAELAMRANLPVEAPAASLQGTDDVSNLRGLRVRAGCDGGVGQRRTRGSHSGVKAVDAVERRLPAFEPGRPSGIGYGTLSDIRCGTPLEAPAERKATYESAVRSGGSPRSTRRPPRQTPARSPRWGVAQRARPPTDRRPRQCVVSGHR